MEAFDYSDLDRMCGTDPKNYGPDVQGPPNRFRVEDVDTIVRRIEPEIVKGLMPRRGVGVIGGPTMSAKTFVAIDMIFRIAIGEPVLNRKVKPTGGLFNAAEAPNGARGRFQGARMVHGPRDHMIQFVGQAANLCDDADVQQLREAIRLAQKDMLDNYGHRLGVVVIDTLSASIPGADENSAKDMSKVLATLQMIAEDFDLFVLFIAHIGKDAERGIRGWSGITANVDLVILINPPNSDGVRIGQVLKVKDGEAGDRFAFRLEQVPLGVDEDGDPVTTCVVRYCPVPAPSATTKKTGPAGIGAAEQLILEAFERLAGAMIELPARHGVMGVRLEQLRNATFDNGFHIETRPSEEEEPALMRRWIEARKKAFQRSLFKLAEAQLVGRENEHVWVISGTTGQDISQPMSRE